MRQPAAGWWSFAHLLAEWSKRDFRIRYTQTLLGSLWAFVQPVALTAAFVFVFGHVAKVKVGIPYASFVFTGMLVWSLFATGVSAATGATVGSLYIAAKAQYPRIVAPVSATLMPLIDLAAGLVLLPILLTIEGAPATFRPQYAVLALVGTLLVALGIGAFLSAVSIFVRDTVRVLPLALQLGLLVTPVAYPASRLPGWLALNPLATFIRGFRACFLEQSPPAWSQWAGALAAAAVLAAAGVAYYRRVQTRFPDVA